MTNFLQLSDEQWRDRLDPDSYRVLREAGTERPGTGVLLTEDRRGQYACKGCGQVLFDAEAKFDSGCGWPSFYEAKEGSVRYIDDHSLGMHRVEVRCAACGKCCSNAPIHRPKSPGPGGRGISRKLPHQNVGLFGERITVRWDARVMAAPS